MEVNGQFHAPVALTLGNEPMQPTDWVGVIAGPDVMRKKNPCCY